VLRAEDDIPLTPGKTRRRCRGRYRDPDGIRGLSSLGDGFGSLDVMVFRKSRDAFSLLTKAFANAWLVFAVNIGAGGAANGALGALSSSMEHQAVDT
jgi:hypothetical protein